MAAAPFSFTNGPSGEIITSFVFPANQGLMRIIREVRGLSDPKATLILTEHFKGAPGITEYAMDLHDITLSANGPQMVEIPFDYAGVPRHVVGATELSASVPSVQTCVRLIAHEGTPHSGKLKCGNLFSPYFTLQLNYQLAGNGSISTDLQVERI